MLLDQLCTRCLLYTTYKPAFALHYCCITAAPSCTSISNSVQEHSNSCSCTALSDCSHKTATIMSDRETRMMARMRREDEARRARRDQITTYGLVAVVVTFGGARYAGHRSLERACLALLGAFGLYAVGVRCGVFYPRISRRRRGCGALRKRRASYHTQVALAAMNAYSESIMQLPEPDSDDEDHDHSHFHAGSIESSDSEEDKDK